MRFNEAIIHGFGKFENFKLDFSPNLTIIHGNNETGKSTLQTFLWAMLFGLVNPEFNTRKKLPEFEKYQPWNSKINFGGVIKYTLDAGIIIEVHRLFEPHKIEIRDGTCGTDITLDFPITKNREPLFAIKHLGLTLKEFLNTSFIRQLKIHEFGEDDQTQISERLISLAETGDEELSVKKAIEKLEKAISQKIGVEDIRSGRPLRLAIEKKEEIDKKLEIARKNHNQILEFVIRLYDYKNKLDSLKKEREIIKNNIANKRIKELKENVNTIVNLTLSLQEKEKELPELQFYADFPQEEWKNVIEFYTAFCNLEIETNKLKEKIKNAIPKREFYGNKLKVFPDIKSANEDMEKIRTIEVDNDKLNYVIRKEQKSIYSIDQDLDKLEKSIQEFLACAGEHKENFIEKMLEKDLQEANLKLQEKEIEAKTAEIKAKEIEIFNTEKNIKNKKIIGIILCLTIIGAVFGIPVLLKLKNLNKNLFAEKTNLNEYKNELEVMYKKFDTNRGTYQNLYKIQILLQQRFNVSNLVELKAKYNEYTKFEIDKLHLKEKRKDVENRIQEYANELIKIDSQSKIILNKWNVKDFSDCKRKYEEYMDLYKQFDIINRELDINSRTIKDRDIKIANVNEQLNAIYNKAKVKNYNEFQINNQKSQRYIKIKSERNEIEEKINLLTHGKSINDFKKELEEIESKIQNTDNRTNSIKEERNEHLDNISIEENVSKEEKYSHDIQELENEIVKLETQLTYMEQNIDTVSELEVEQEEIEKKIKYFQTEKRALDLARSNIDEITETFHRTRFVPELKKLVNPLLKNITDKYEEIFVDEKLKISVRIPDLQKLVDISKLSIGAQEQIYFIFKTAIGRILTRGGEKVPIVLDDVFVNFDSVRRNKVWEVLYSISRENQVILLTCQNNFINEWINIFNTKIFEYKDSLISQEFRIITV